MSPPEKTATETIEGLMWQIAGHRTPVGPSNPAPPRRTPAAWPSGESGQFVCAGKHAEWPQSEVNRAKQFGAERAPGPPGCRAELSPPTTSPAPPRVAFSEKRPRSARETLGWARFYRDPSFPAVDDLPAAHPEREPWPAPAAVPPKLRGESGHFVHRHDVAHNPR